MDVGIGIAVITAINAIAAVANLIAYFVMQRKFNAIQLAPHIEVKEATGEKTNHVFISITLRDSKWEIVSIKSHSGYGVLAFTAPKDRFSMNKDETEALFSPPVPEEEKIKFFICFQNSTDILEKYLSLLLETVPETITYTIKVRLKSNYKMTNEIKRIVEISGVIETDIRKEIKKDISNFLSS